MIRTLTLIRRPRPGWARIAVNGDEMGWVHAKVGKPWVCALTGQPIPPGTKVYRPCHGTWVLRLRILAEALDSLTYEPDGTPAGQPT